MSIFCNCLRNAVTNAIKCRNLNGAAATGYGTNSHADEFYNTFNSLGLAYQLLNPHNNSAGFHWSRAYEPQRDLIASLENGFNAVTVSRFDYLNNAIAMPTRRVDTFGGSALPVTNAFTNNMRGYYVGGAGCLLSMTLVTNDDAKTYFYCQDALGNIVQMLDDEGATVAEYEYDPYGGQIRSTGSKALGNIFRYGAHIYDQEAGIYYARNRYFSQSIGRFLSRDRIREAGGINIYEYCSNDPVNQADWFGLAGYKIGTSDPHITPDPGSGPWNSEPATIGMVMLKASIIYAASEDVVWLA